MQSYAAMINGRKISTLSLVHSVARMMRRTSSTRILRITMAATRTVNRTRPLCEGLAVITGPRCVGDPFGSRSSRGTAVYTGLNLEIPKRTGKALLTLTMAKAHAARAITRVWIGRSYAADVL